MRGPTSKEREGNGKEGNGGKKKKKGGKGEERKGEVASWLFLRGGGVDATVSAF